MVRRFEASLRAALLAALALSLLSPAAAFAQAHPRKLLIKPSRSVIAPGHDRTRINVKFQDGLSVDKENGSKLREVGDLGLSSARAVSVLARIRAVGGHWRPACRMDRPLLERLRLRAQESTGREIADLAAFYTLTLPVDSDTEGILDALNGLPEVELAYAASQRANAPAVPDYEPSQVSLGPSPGGLDAQFAWTLPGGTGDGVTICDIEDGWNLQHEDLPPATVMVPDGETPYLWADDHGTEVLGTMFALRNGWGTTGASYGARCAVAPQGLVSGDNPFAQILWAAAHLEAGDVLLVETGEIGPYFRGDGSDIGYVPAEWDPAIYQAIVTAVGNGIHVVEPAGNGSQNLDDPVYAAGNFGHAPFLRENDSGAIIVGAGVPPTAPELGPDRSTSWFSNYGSRVDVQGWGHRVYTTGSGELYAAEGPNRSFTWLFGGTSAASPQIASAVASIEGIVEHRGLPPVAPRLMRDLLARTGKPQQDGSRPATTTPIGPRPDLRAAIERMNAPMVSSPRAIRAYEGDTLAFTVLAADLDGDPVDQFTVGSMPPGAAFDVAPDRGRGDFTWPVQSGQAGTYAVVFSAANSEADADTTRIEIGNADRAPVVLAGSQLSIESHLTRIIVTAHDPNGDPMLSFTASDLPRGATFTSDSTNASGEFVWQPDFDQAGQYLIALNAVSCRPGGEPQTGHGILGVTVFNADRDPVVTAPTSYVGDEGHLLSFAVSAMDPDGDAIDTFYCSPLPAGATFVVDPSNQAGEFTWTPNFSQAGSYSLTFYAKNRYPLPSRARTALVVANTERPPIVLGPAFVEGTEGEAVQFDVTASDPDGNIMVNLFGVGLPTGSSFDVNSIYSHGQFHWLPHSGDAGRYNITIIGLSRPSVPGALPADTALVEVSIAPGRFSAQARLVQGDDPVRLATGRASTRVWVEPTADEFDPANVDPATIRLTVDGSPDPGIPASSVSTVGDRDQNGTPELEVSFSKDDLRRLCQAIPDGAHLVLGTFAGGLANGGAFQAPLAMQVLTQRGIQSAAVSPNPSRVTPTLSFYSSKTARARLAVYDVQGRLVSLPLDARPLESGFHDVPLRGSARGRRLSAGIYYYRLELAEGRASGRFVVLK